MKRLSPIIISTIAFLLGWYLITRYSGVPNFILPSPLSVWTRFIKAIRDGSLPYHTWITFSEILLGLLFGVLFATIVGYILAKSRSLEKVLVAAGESARLDFNAAEMNDVLKSLT